MRTITETSERYLAGLGVVETTEYNIGVYPNTSVVSYIIRRITYTDDTGEQSIVGLHRSGDLLSAQTKDEMTRFAKGLGLLVPTDIWDDDVVYETASINGFICDEEEGYEMMEEMMAQEAELED